MTHLRALLLSLLVAATVQCVSAQSLHTSFGAASLKSEAARSTIEKIEKVNAYWQSHNRAECRAFWDNAAYFTGNWAAYLLTGNQDYYDYQVRFAEHAKWTGATERNPKNWKWKQYGEGMQHVLFADWQLCYSIYIDLYKEEHRAERLARALEVLNTQAAMPDRDFWWWSDALYMGMPMFTKLYSVTGNQRLLDKQYESFRWTDSLLYDTEAQLYYRDAKYIWPKVKTACNGGKSFWARGDGWVLAGLAKVLEDLPKDSEYRAFYVQRFRQLAEGVARCQQPEGHWTRSMLCPDDAPGCETSGTGFFTYGLAWGVNNGLLPTAKYKPVIEKAWKYLSEIALQADGSIGFVQPIGEKPDPTRTVDSHSQAPFGTGAWLLAATEYAKLCK